LSGPSGLRKDVTAKTMTFIIPTASRCVKVAVINGRFAEDFPSDIMQKTAVLSLGVWTTEWPDCKRRSAAESDSEPKGE